MGTMIGMTKLLGLCDGCGLMKKIRMYAFDSGWVAWLCKDCRRREKE